MQAILDLVQKLGPQRLAAMGAVTLSLIGFFAFVLMRATTPAMTTLYTDVSPTESAAIVKELEQRGIRHEVRADGAVILVARDAVSRTRMELAAKGLPSGGGVGYEIFDKGDSFSSTSFVQNINQLRALEGELSRTIRGIDRVQTARVHIAMPERRLFQKDKAEPRASIVLKVRGELEQAQVRAIRHLVATAVDGLKPGKISIIDEAGRLLADGAGEESDTGSIAADRQAAHEKRLKAQVEDIVASVVGRGRARVQIAAEIDNNRVQQTSETYDPESRVVRSTQTRSETNASSEARDGQVSVGNELPGAQKNDAQGVKEKGEKSEETINYEISRTTRTETIEGGRLKRLSVAVLVDGVYAKGAGGETTYAPRTPEELSRIASLVRMGVGFDKVRGDQVEVINLRFAETPVDSEMREPGFMERMLSFSREDILRLSEMGVFALMTLVILFFVVRPLMRQITAPIEKPAPGLAAAGSSALSASPNAEQQPRSAEPARTAGLLPAGGSLEAIGAQIASQPQEAAAILKTWIRSAA